MRLISLPGFISIVALVILTNSALAGNSVKLSGRITNAKSDTLQVSYNDNYLAYYPKDFYATVDTKGNFSLEFPIPPSSYLPVEIRYNNHVADLILHQGDSLALTVNEARFDSSIHYVGKGSAIQNFVARHTIEKGRMNQYANRIRAAMSKDTADFIKTIADEKKSEIDFLKKYKQDLPFSFINYWTAYYQYYNYFFMEQYPQMHEIVRLKRYTDTIPVENFSVIKKLPYAFNDSMMQLPPYLLYLGGIFEIKMKAAGYNYMGTDTSKKRMFADSITHLAYKMLPDKSAEYFIAQGLYSTAKYQPIERTRFQYDAFKKHWPGSGYLTLLDMQVSMAEKLAPGQPAPDFDIITPEGKQMKLSDLKGKVVYLGFWATWCRQCVGEMISERKPKDVLKNKPVEFVYVSIDNDTASSMKIARKYKIDGIFHFAEGGWKAKEIQLYGVQGMPAYFLIDKEGKIAVQNPPTPIQSTELIVAISKLL